MEKIESPEKELFWKIDFKGKMHVPAEANFHPNLFVGTRKEYNNIYNKFLKGKEDEFKIIGEHSFDNYEDYKKAFGNL